MSHVIFWKMSWAHFCLEGSCSRHRRAKKIFLSYFCEIRYSIFFSFHRVEGSVHAWQLASDSSLSFSGTSLKSGSNFEASLESSAAQRWCRSFLNRRYAGSQPEFTTRRCDWILLRYARSFRNHSPVHQMIFSFVKALLRFFSLGFSLSNHVAAILLPAWIIWFHLKRFTINWILAAARFRCSHWAAIELILFK